MVTSSMIQEAIVDFLMDGEPHSVQEIKTYLAEININGYTEGQFSGSLNTLQRNGTIKKNDRGVYSLKQDGEDEDSLRTCLILSPIGEEGSDTRKNADQLFNYIIKPVCDACGFIAERVHQMSDADSISQEALDGLEDADLVIADISENNPKVFYAMGFRKRTGKPIIHLRKKDDSLHFDTSLIRTFDYILTDLDSVEEIKSRLEKTIGSIVFMPDDGISSERGTTVQEDMLSHILPRLYEMHDAINVLNGNIKNYDERVQAALDTVYNRSSQNSQLSQEDRIIEQMLPLLIQNPDAMAKLVEIGTNPSPRQAGRITRR